MSIFFFYFKEYIYRQQSKSRQTDRERRNYAWVVVGIINQPVSHPYSLFSFSLQCRSKGCTSTHTRMICTLICFTIHFFIFVTTFNFFFLSLFFSFLTFHLKNRINNNKRERKKCSFKAKSMHFIEISIARNDSLNMFDM